MTRPIRWGVLGVAGIAVKKVLPAMTHCERGKLHGIASRDLARAQKAAAEFGMEKAYGSYEELLADPDIDAVYNPLPNHLHVPWSIHAAEAGKHVLCEKPIALSAAQCSELIASRDRTGVKVGEAFMVRTHPQWIRTREIVRSGQIGPLRSVVGFFSYHNVDRNNIRNIAEYGGGGVMDIGCYPITMSRWMFGEEPVRVMPVVERDPETKVDRLASAVLEFPSGQAIFTCSTQLAPYQRMHFLGTKGRVEVEIPFNAPPDKHCRIFVDGEVEEFPVCDQYTIQADEFARAIQEDGEVAVPLEDALANMVVIEKVLSGDAS